MDADIFHDPERIKALTIFLLAEIEGRLDECRLDAHKVAYLIDKNSIDVSVLKANTGESFREVVMTFAAALEIMAVDIGKLSTELKKVYAKV